MGGQPVSAGGRQRAEIWIQAADKVRLFRQAQEKL